MPCHNNPPMISVVTRRKILTKFNIEKYFINV